jgi:hypothetical protein
MDPLPESTLPVESPLPDAPSEAPTDAPSDVALGVAPETLSDLSDRTAAHMDPMAKEASREQVESLLRASGWMNRPMGGASTGVPVSRDYPSLYDSTGTTIVAIVLGIAIVGGIQVAVQQIYVKSKNEHELLTRFVVSLVALVVGAYITDLLIAGPDTSLLSDDEHTIILGFIKDICLMVFAFYFGTKASSSQPPPSSES